MVRRHGLGPTEDPAQGIEPLLDGAIADRLLPNLHRCPQRGKRQCRRRYAPQAHRLARPVVIVVRLRMAHSFRMSPFLSSPYERNIRLAGVRSGALSALMNSPCVAQKLAAGPIDLWFLVDAVTSFFQGRQPDLAWLY